MDNINTEKLITEIENRPAIWDMRSPDYSEKIKRKISWNEIVEIFSEESFTEADKISLSEVLQKKWKNIRDRYSREVHEKHFGDGSKKKTPYRYTWQLGFLNDTLLRKTTNSTDKESEDDSLLNSNRTEEEDSHSSFFTFKERNAKKPRLDPVEVKLIEVLENRETESDKNEDKLFLLSLVPTMKAIPFHLKLSAKIELMQVLQKYRNNSYEDDSKTTQVKSEQTQRYVESPSAASCFSNFSDEEV